MGWLCIKTVKTIRRIAAVTETYLSQRQKDDTRTSTTKELLQTAALAHSVGQIVKDISAKMVAVWSQTGETARLLSKERIDVPILALSSETRTCHQMSLHYGVIPRCQPISENIDSFTRNVDHQILSRKWARIGDKIVLLVGQPLSAPGTTNAIIIHSIIGDK